MPQEPQPVDLEELTRLYEIRIGGSGYVAWRTLMDKAFLALRDELLQYRSGAVKQIVSEINKQVDDSVALRKENAEMRDELVRLREATKPVSRSNSDKFFESQVNEIGEKIVLRAQLDEAKGLLELLVQEDGLLANHEPRSSSLGSLARDARAFLASLAGRDAKHKTPCPHCEHPKFYAQAICANCGKFPTSQQPEQPTQEDDEECGTCGGLLGYHIAGCPEKPTQGEACLHNWQLSQGAVVYKCTKCGDKTTTPPQEVEGGEVV